MTMPRLVALACGVACALGVSGSSGGPPSQTPSAGGPAPSELFWSHWGDGRAELNGYRLVQPRYGAPRPGTALLVFVTEDFSDSLRVKADPGRHPASDVSPVMKLNAVRDFQTGIYDYNVMTSVFARVAAGWPVSKVSFSSQEWCGHVYQQLIPRGGRIASVSHSYFDGEADRAHDLPHPPDGVFEDALPIILREWGGPFLRRGDSRKVSFLPSLLASRLQHRPLAWSQAVISLAPEVSRVTVPAGRFEVVTWTVAPEGAARATYQFEAAAPYRLVRWTTETGEEASLLGSERLAYWKLNGPGGEAHLRKLGLMGPGPGRAGMVE